MNIAVHENTQAISAATALGVLTVTSTADLYPGTNAWVYKTDGSAQQRVKILFIISATTLQVRGYKNNDENSPPSYGLSDMTAFTAGSAISMETQTAPVDPAFAKRHVF